MHRASTRILPIIAISVFFFTPFGTFQSSAFAEPFFEMLSLINRQTWDLSYYKQYIGPEPVRMGDKIYSVHAPGQTLIMIPTYVSIGLVVESFIRNYTSWSDTQILMTSGWITQTVTHVIIIVFALSTLYYTLSHLMFHRTAYFVTIGLYSTSLIPGYAKIGLSEAIQFGMFIPYVSFFILYLAGYRLIYLFWSGFFLGWLILVREQYVLLCAVAPVVLLINNIRGHDRIKILALQGAVMGSPVLAASIFHLVRNEMVFGDIFSFPTFHVVLSPELASKAFLSYFQNATPDLIYQWFWGPSYGLLHTTPVLIFGYFAIRSNTLPFTIRIFLGSNFLLILILFLCMRTGIAGWAVGWRRMLVPTSALLLLILMQVALNWDRIYPKSVVLITVSISVILNAIVLITSPWEPKPGIIGQVPFQHWRLKTLLVEQGGVNVLTKGRLNKGLWVYDSYTPFWWNLVTTALGIAILVLIIWRTGRNTDLGIYLWRMSNTRSSLKNSCGPSPMV